jgi:hypothetical protein
MAVKQLSVNHLVEKRIRAMAAIERFNTLLKLLK